MRNLERAFLFKKKNHSSCCIKSHKEMTISVLFHLLIWGFLAYVPQIKPYFFRLRMWDIKPAFAF